MFAGLATLAAGLLGAIAAYHRSDPVTYPWLVLAALAVSGLGLGLFTVPFFTTALQRVRPHETGSAAGLLNAVQQLGATLGVAAFGSLFLHTLATARPGGASGAAALTAVQHAFWLALGLVAATTASAALMRIPPGAPGSLRAGNLEPGRRTTSEAGRGRSGRPGGRRRATRA